MDDLFIFIQNSQCFIKKNSIKDNKVIVIKNNNINIIAYYVVHLFHWV